MSDFKFKFIPSTFLSGIFLLLSACSSEEPKPVETFEGGGPESISFMTYNVENLFDTSDDEGKMDEAYLPIAQKQSQEHKDLCEKNNPDGGSRLITCLEFDWSQELYAEKVRRLAEVISSVSHTKAEKGRSLKGPDILVLQEVENINALNALNDALGDKAYPTVLLLEGPDLRGIDIAILSRFPVSNSQLHPIPLVENGLSDRPTRSILQADLKINDSKTLTVFGVHFPSPGHPTPERMLAFQTLLKAYKKLPGDRAVLAAGDFNVTSREIAEKDILSVTMKKEGFLVSHEAGCESCPGSSYYHREDPEYRWSFLDMIFISGNLADKSESSLGGHKLAKDSIRLQNKIPYQSNRFGNPAYFLDRSKTEVEGVSDHWPIVLELVR